MKKPDWLIRKEKEIIERRNRNRDKRIAEIRRNYAYAKKNNNLTPEFEEVWGEGGEAEKRSIETAEKLIKEDLELLKKRYPNYY